MRTNLSRAVGPSARCAADADRTRAEVPRLLGGLLLRHQVDGLPVHLDLVGGPAEVGAGHRPGVPPEPVGVGGRAVPGVHVAERGRLVPTLGLHADDRRGAADDVGAGDPAPVVGVGAAPAHGGPGLGRPGQRDREVDRIPAVPRGVDRVRGVGRAEGHLARRRLLRLGAGVRVAVGVAVGVRVRVAVRVGVTVLRPARVLGHGVGAGDGGVGLARGEQGDEHVGLLKKTILVHYPTTPDSY